MAESEEELKNLVMRVKEESAKNGLKLNIKKTKIAVQKHLSNPRLRTTALDCKEIKPIHSEGNQP